MKPLLILIALVCVGCVEANSNGSSREYYIDQAADHGHLYLVAVGRGSYGISALSMIHAEHCQCKGGR